MDLYLNVWQTQIQTENQIRMSYTLIYASDFIICFREAGNMQDIKAVWEASMHTETGIHILFVFKSTISLSHCFKTKKINLIF